MSAALCQSVPAHLPSPEPARAPSRASNTEAAFSLRLAADGSVCAEIDAGFTKVPKYLDIHYDGERERDTVIFASAAGEVRCYDASSGQELFQGSTEGKSVWVYHVSPEYIIAGGEGQVEVYCRRSFELLHLLKLQDSSGRPREPYNTSGAGHRIPGVSAMRVAPGRRGFGRSLYVGDSQGFCAWELSTGKLWCTLDREGLVTQPSNTADIRFNGLRGADFASNDHVYEFEVYGGVLLSGHNFRWAAWSLDIGCFLHSQPIAGYVRKLELHDQGKQLLMRIGTGMGGPLRCLATRA